MADDQAPRTQDLCLRSSLLTRLREGLPEQRVKLRQAMLAQPIDTRELSAQAHRLAGAAAYCGEDGLMRAATALEQAAEVSGAPELKRAWAALDAVLEAAVHSD
jgi:HPt (histidine-containing phosphotransfer) domain-containing protein